MRFMPRRVHMQDILASAPNRILLSPGISRFYEVTDIVCREGRYYQVVSVDRQDDVLNLKDVTTAVTVNGESV